MKKRLILPSLLLGATLLGLPKALAEVIITLNNGEVIRVSQVDNIQVNQNGNGMFVVTYTDGSTVSFSLSEIKDMDFGEKEFPVEPEPSDDPNVITIVWNGTEAPSITCSAPGVTISTEGGNVFVTNTNTDTEYTYILRGQSTDGSLTLTADYKSTVQLDGLDLQSSLEEALNIKCGKRIALVVNDGTVNTLADATTDNGQKGALYCKGHLEVEGGGTLNLTGNVKHALSTKEYLQLKKKFTGTLNVLGAANDGIHAGQYFQMNAGNVTIKNVKGDGIQAEATTDPTDEQNGQMIIKGGKADITITGNDASAMKCDSLMTISDGTFTMTTSGAGDKALKSKTTVSVSGGNFTIAQTGKPYIEAGDLSYVSAVKADEAIEVSGGKWDITNSVIGGRGFSSDKDVTISGTADITMTLSGNGGTASDAIEGSAEPDPNPGDQEEPKSYKVYVYLPSGGGQGGPGGQGGSGAWGTVAVYKSDGTLLGNVTTTVTVNGTSFRCYDFKQSTSGTFYFGNPNGYMSGGGWGGGTTYTIKSSTFEGPTDGKDHFYQASSQYSTSGTTRTYTLTDVTSRYQGGTIGGSTTDADSYTAKGIKADHNVSLLGGTINIKTTGTGAKGIKVDGDMFVGDKTTGEGPILSVVTTGASYGSGTSTGGGGWGGPGGGESSGSSSKAIKVEGSYWQYGGSLYINTATSGAEGIESKTRSATSMNFNGGSVYLYCYDDCINSAGAINFNGAHVMAISYGNDAIDSNYGQSGALSVTNGAVIAFSTKGGAEMGFDCDNNSYIKFTGGTLVAGGGSQGGSGSSSLGSGSVHYKVWSGSISYTANNYYSVTASNAGVFTFCLPVAVNSSYNFYACSDFKSSTSHSLVRNTTAPAGGSPVLFRTSATDLVGKPLFWRPTDVTSGTSVTTFSPN